MMQAKYNNLLSLNYNNPYKAFIALQQSLDKYIKSPNQNSEAVKKRIEETKSLLKMAGERLSDVSKYVENTAQIDFSSLPKVLQEGNTWMIEALPYYGKSRVVKRVADRFVDELNNHVAPGAPSTKSAPAKKLSSEAEEAIEFLKVLLEDAAGKEAEEIEEAIEFIKLVEA